MKNIKIKDLKEYNGIWHTVSYKYINTILDNNFLEARTTQRYWKDGKIHRDNEGDVYDNSFFVKGWSMTRDPLYAFTRGGGITFLLDWELIRRDFKYKTISWNYTISSCQKNFGKEREEFIISNYMNQTLKEIQDEYFRITDDIYDNLGKEALFEWEKNNGTDWVDYWQRKGTKTISLDKYLKAIFISKETYDIFNGKYFEKVIEHSLFKGYYDDNYYSEKYNNSLQKLYVFNRETRKIK